MDHQDLFGLDPEEAGEHLHRLTARFHEALRKEQPGRARGTRSLDLADEGLEFSVLAQCDALGRSKALDQPEARVVPRALVLLARVAQAYDESDQGLLLLFLLALVGSRGLLRGSLALLAFLALLALGRRTFAFLRRSRLLGGRNVG